VAAESELTTKYMLIYTYPTVYIHLYILKYIFLNSIYYIYIYIFPIHILVYICMYIYIRLEPFLQWQQRVNLPPNICLYIHTNYIDKFVYTYIYKLFIYIYIYTFIYSLYILVYIYIRSEPCLQWQQRVN
jgi:hypothetical protein